MNNFWALDFEASSLNMAISYPIEVGYTNGIIEREFLITPHPDWFDWDPASQEIHNIPRKLLFEEGFPGPKVCHEMNKDLANQTVYCDGGIFDVLWLLRLFDTANISPLFELTNYDTSNLKEKVAHRALADAKQIWKLINDATKL